MATKLSAEEKAAVKEGGKKGVDIVGMSDLGGVKFFNVNLETANGDLKLISRVLEGMNAPVDEAAEERKGGAGHLGKMLLSAAESGKSLVLLCNVPAELAEQYAESFKPADWVDRLVTAAGGTVVSRETTGDTTTVLIEGDPEKGLFPLKMRDAAQEAGFAFLREKGLIPADDDSDDYIPDPESVGIEW